jgi:hypothetical protein
MKYSEFKDNIKKNDLISIELDFSLFKRIEGPVSFLVIDFDDDFLHALPIYFSKKKEEYVAGMILLVPYASILSFYKLPVHNLLFYCEVKNKYIYEAFKKNIGDAHAKV